MRPRASRMFWMSPFQCYRVIAAILSVVLVLGCQQAHSRATTRDGAVSRRAPLANGAYAVLREAATPEEARTARAQGREADAAGAAQVERVIVYDRRTYSDAPADEPLVYVSIDPDDYVPLVIDAAPVL